MVKDLYKEQRIAKSAILLPETIGDRKDKRKVIEVKKEVKPTKNFMNMDAKEMRRVAYKPPIGSSYKK